MRYPFFCKQLSITILLLVFFFTLTGARKGTCRNKPRPLHLMSVYIVDRNGFSETFSTKDRLKQLQGVDFSKPQPYKKVLRMYERDSRGDIRSVVNTYHENSNPKQFLEILNGRANGNYLEWHENGCLHLQTLVVNGNPDVTCAAEKTWIFDGPSFVWDEDGKLSAEIFYCQGAMEGVATYYHPCGAIWKKIPYRKNVVDGAVEIYKNNGDLLQKMLYVKGKKEGESLRYWKEGELAAQECYRQDRLENAQYFNQAGELVAEVNQGNGYRATFGKNHINELQQYQEGILDGEIKVYLSTGQLKRIYHVKNDKKHGQEIEYYEQPIACSSTLQPHLLFNWYDGKVQGTAKTWYSNGNIESQKEMANNSKNGVLTAWYKDGNIMLIEEYDNNKLMRGDYFRKGEKIPISQISQGKGTVTIFDAEGHFVQKIPYTAGKPDV